MWNCEGEGKRHEFCICDRKILEERRVWRRVWIHRCIDTERYRESESETERERETDRETERERERHARFTDENRENMTCKKKFRYDRLM